MPRVLIVAYYFAPIGGIGSIRLTRFASMLPDLGWETTVLAPADTPHQLDEQLRFPEERVIRSKSIEVSTLARRVLALGRRGQAAASTESGMSMARRDAIYSYALFPDAQVGWYPAAVRAGLRALRNERFDAVFSSSNPMTAHLIARTLSSRAGVPWIAEYRDPWADRLYANHPYRRAADALERSVARRAAKIVMPTPTWAEHYGTVWRADVDVLPNGADTDLPPRRRPERPTLTHIGTYYPGEQDLTTLWQALVRLRAGSAHVPRVRFVGRVPDALRTEIDRYGLADIVDSTGFIPQQEAMREMMSASMLVASGIAGDDPASRGWVPAKLFEYLASDLPVLYLSRRDTDAARMLDGRPGCHVVAPEDVEGTLKALESGLAGGDTPRDVTDLSREARARSLAQILEKATR
jgi:glycosyltransferase involved in cell wall biosynthesis